MQRPEEATILVVEDHPMLRPMIQKRLLIAGYERSYCLSTVAEAIVWLKGGPVDVLVLDVNLGPGDQYGCGCQAGVAIATRWPEVRLLFMSGMKRENLVGRCPDGFPFIGKPFALEELLAKIAETLMLPPWRP